MLATGRESGSHSGCARTLSPRTLVRPRTTRNNPWLPRPPEQRHDSSHLHRSRGAGSDEPSGNSGRLALRGQSARNLCASLSGAVGGPPTGRSGFGVRVEKAPKGRGSGEQWVREAYPKEVKALRSKRYIEGRALVVIIDEDTQSTGARTVGLGQALKGHDLSDRPRDEAIIHVIPARNIETLITYLAGQDVNETTAYPNLDRPGNCADLVGKLMEMCDQRALRQRAPASLERACVEFHARWRRAGASG